MAAAHRRRRAGAALSRLQHWAITVAARRGYHKATLAVANKLGRLIWAVWTSDVPFATKPATAR